MNLNFDDLKNYSDIINENDKIIKHYELLKKVHINKISKVISNFTSQIAYLNLKMDDYLIEKGFTCIHFKEYKKFSSIYKDHLNKHYYYHEKKNIHLSYFYDIKNKEISMNLRGKNQNKHKLQFSSFDQLKEEFDLFFNL